MHPAHYDTLLANQDTHGIMVEISTFHRKFYIFLSESLLSPRKFYFLLIAVLGRRLIIFGSKFPVEIRPVRNADFIDNFLYAHAHLFGYQLQAQGFLIEIFPDNGSYGIHKFFIFLMNQLSAGLFVGALR